MNRTAEMVLGKSVALVGNAQSLLTQGKAAEIDAHDVVIRINLGIPGIVPAPQIGERTDIWATAKFWGVDKVPKDAKIAVFMKLTQLGDKHWSELVYANTSMVLQRWPQRLEDEVKEFVGADPGTGIRILYWLKRYAKPSSVSVYGMDCWETPTHWSHRMNTPNHKPDLEKKALEALLA